MPLARPYTGGYTRLVNGGENPIRAFAPDLTNTNLLAAVEL